MGNSTVESDFDWLNVLGGGEKQTDHAVDLGEQNYMKFEDPTRAVFLSTDLKFGSFTAK